MVTGRTAVQVPGVPATPGMAAFSPLNPSVTPGLMLNPHLHAGTNGRDTTPTFATRAASTPAPAYTPAAFVKQGAAWPAWQQMPLQL